MCNSQLPVSRMWLLLLSQLLSQVTAYPAQSWPMYAQIPREYSEDDYYYAPKMQYYYDAPASMAVPEHYGQVGFPYLYDPYNHFINEEPNKQDERLASLPIGQETWFESDPNPHWRTNSMDDVNAAFLDNLILTQMAQDAQRRRENARAAFAAASENNEKNTEDEDVRELKALAGEQLYHAPNTVPRFDDDDYVADDGFINWNGNKRSFTATTPSVSTTNAKEGQKEIVMPRPAHEGHRSSKNKKSSKFYDDLAEILSKPSSKESQKERRIDKRFVSGDTDLVLELRGLKHRIPT